MNICFFLKKSIEIDACFPGGLKIRPKNLAALDISSVGFPQWVQPGAFHEGPWNWVGPCGVLPSPSLGVGNRLHSASLTFPAFEGRSKQGRGREGIQKQGRSHQETIVQAWGRVLVPPQERYVTIPLSSSAETKAPPRWRKVTSAGGKIPGASQSNESHTPYSSPLTFCL